MQYSNSAIAEHEYCGLPLGNLTSQLLVNIYLGVDFIGWVHFPKHRVYRVLRITTKKRMFRYGNTYKLCNLIEKKLP